jgi:transposase
VAPAESAQLARRRLRAKLVALEEALRGFFTDHHAVILPMMLDNIDRHSQQVAALDTTIEQAIAPFAGQVAQLDEITGVGRVAAQELIAEVGVDMARFASAAHLVSWAKFCPQVHESAGKSKPKGRGKGNPWLAGTLGNIVAVAARTDSFLGARYRRIAKRRGQQKAIVATGNSVLVIVYHLLCDPDTRFHDLGAEHDDLRIDKQRRARSLAAQLQAVTGQRIVIQDGKAVIVQPEAA